MPARRTRRPKLRPRKAKPSAALIGLGLILTRAEIQKLKALAASHLRSASASVGRVIVGTLAGK